MYICRGQKPFLKSLTAAQMSANRVHSYLGRYLCRNVSVFRVWFDKVAQKQRSGQYIGRCCEYKSKFKIAARVTRFGEISPFRQLFISDMFLKITKVAQILELLFSSVKIMHWFRRKNGWAKFGAIFSRTHLVALIAAYDRGLRPETDIWKFITKTF
jgi:hypothetical protein